MSVTLIFEAHGTTFDNETHLSSGWYDVALSPKGEQQSREMGERYKDDHFDAIFCSDLQRAYKSAEIGFGDKWPIIQDARLRECNYGDFTQKPSAIVDEEKPKSKGVAGRLRAAAERLRGTKKGDDDSRKVTAKPTKGGGAGRKITTPRKAGGS